VPAHPRMRGFDRDLIRGEHYGQRSCEPRKQAEHMAAPTNAANVKKILAHPEPSIHGHFILHTWRARPVSGGKGRPLCTRFGKSTAGCAKPASNAFAFGWLFGLIIRRFLA